MEAERWVPTDDDLVAFDRGLLAEAEMGAVAGWLEANPQGDARLEQLAVVRPDSTAQALRRHPHTIPDLDPAPGLVADIIDRVLREGSTGPPPGPLATVPTAMPEVIREYRLERALGQGGMGQVYLARHARLNRDVAIKVLPAALAADPWYRARFEREMAVVGPLDHPNLVRAHDAGLEGGHLFLVMELLQGMDLGRLLAERGRLPVNDACELVRQAAVGLHYAHENGLVHRDVKPSNLFVTSAGVVKVIDLGLARAGQVPPDGKKLSSGQFIMGTPDYLAPEQWQSTAVDRRADIYSLGCVVYEFLTGRAPFQGQASAHLAGLMLAHCQQPPPALKADRPDVPAPLAKLVARMLAKAPDARPGTAQAVGEALAGFTSGHNLPALLRAEAGPGLGAAPTPVRKAGLTTVGRLSRKPLLLAAGAALVAAVLAGLYLRPPPRGTVPIDPPGQASAALPDTYTNSLGMVFARVPKGKAWLGGADGNPGDREVEVLADFYLGKYEVTQEEWEKVMKGNPSAFARTGAAREAVKDVLDEDLKRFPVEMVSWNDAQQFLAALDEAEKDFGWTYRLPTFVEWEYACRGGPMARKADGAFSFYFDPPANQVLPGQANFQHAKGPGRPCKAGSYPPSRLGLHDLYGNVEEWCHDAVTTPEQTVGRYIRGGAYQYPGHLLGFSTAEPPGLQRRQLGLRVARVPVRQANPRRDDFKAWREEVAALPAHRQGAAVADLLRAHNPYFHDQVTARVAGDVVTELSFLTNNATDLEPVQALPRLRVFGYSGRSYCAGELADLGPLKDLPLTHLDCRLSLVADLSPLKSMPLRELNCDSTLVADLSPLEALSLRELSCEHTLVANLTPLKGMKQLAILRCRGARVTDLSPLRGLPLRELTCDFRPERDIAILRSLETLKTINGKSAAAFWQEVGVK